MLNLGTLLPTVVATALGGQAPTVDLDVTTLTCNGDGSLTATAKADDVDGDMTRLRVISIHFTGGTFTQIKTLLYDRTFANPQSTRTVSFDFVCEPGDLYTLQVVAFDATGNVTGVTLPENFQCNPPASIASENPGGTNPSSYTATGTDPLGGATNGEPILGGTVTLSVAASATGHTSSGVLTYLAPATQTLGGGQVLLLDVAHPAGEILGLGVQTGDFFIRLNVPNEPAICGLSLYTQGIAFGGGNPFALTNRLILTPGF